MTDPDPADPSLLAENASLREQLAESQETLRAIRAGEVDALVVESAQGPQLFVLQNTDAEANRFRSDILAKVSEAIVAVDESGHIIFLNTAAEQQYGATSAEVLGSPRARLYEELWTEPDDEARALAALRESGHWRGQMRHRKRSGEIVHVETSLSPLHAPDGIASGTLAVIRDITARTAAEETLKNSERLFSTIIEQAPGGVYVVDENFRMMKVNSLARPIFAAAEPIIGRDLGEIMRIVWGPELGANISAIFRHTLETGERYVSPRFTEERHDLGVQQSYEWELQRLTLPNGRHGVVCYFTDTTERERAAAALRESENFNRSIVESSRDCMKVLDLEGRLLSMSPRGLTLLGIADLQAFLGKSWCDFWEGAHREAACEALKSAVTGGGGAMLGFLRTPAGDEKWFDVALSPIADASGAPVRVLVVSRDVTDRRRAELDAQFLAEVSQDLASLSDVGQIMQVVGAKLGAHLRLSLCTFVDVNEAGDEVVVRHAWHRPDVLSPLGTYRLADYVSPEFQTAHRAGEPFIIRDTATDPRTDAARFAALKVGAFVSIPLVRDGQWRFMLSIHHTEPHDWQPEEISLAREITERLWTRLERVRIKAALAERVADLARADRSKDEFLAMLAHELRNPLAPLRNATEILRTPEARDDERVQAQRILIRQIENMSRMIEDLLDVSRITEGRITLRKKPVALEAIVTAAASMVRSACAAQRQQLEISLPPEPVWVDADATRLEQVFNNLLGNASKYSGEGTHIRVSAEVIPAASSREPEIAITVRDDGAGIDPEVLPRIFDLFVQASRTLDRSHGGLGIGLTLVQRLVALHGGSVAAHSDGLGHGAAFTVRLPVLREAPPAPAPQPPTITAEIRRRILIVDDNKDSARSLATLQKRRGHETRTAFTGPEAVAVAEEFLPEVVLLDIGLPGMDGFEVARRLRANPALNGAVIIAMSGYGRDEDRTEAKEAGFDEYMVKPVDLDQLRKWLGKPGAGK